ncbi:MAG: copper(I)-binding protein [Candidatus Azotimanducaceae bacterium]|jgi:copper(I)-binding protein
MLSLSCVVFSDSEGSDSEKSDGLNGSVASAQGNPLVKTRLWARATPPGGTSGAIYGELTNMGPKTWYLKSVGIEHAKHVMVHRTVLEDGMMKMKHASVSIPPGETVRFEPGGLHVMVMGLAEPLIKGCLYEVTLHWGNGTITREEFNTGHFGQSQYPDAAAQRCH